MTEGGLNLGTKCIEIDGGRRERRRRNQKWAEQHEWFRPESETGWPNRSSASPRFRDCRRAGSNAAVAVAAELFAAATAAKTAAAEAAAATDLAEAADLTEGTAAAYSGPIIFQRLGIKVDAKFNPHTVAMQEMRKGDAYAATVWVSSKPLPPFLKGDWPQGFKFLPVPYSDNVEYYLPTYLEHEDYPALIAKGSRIPTIAVPAVLAVYDWPADTERYRRMVRFVDYFVERLPKLQTEPGYHKNWKDVSLSAAVPGWQRFRPLSDRLERAERERPKAAPAAAATAGGATAQLPTPSAAEEAARRQAARAAPGDPAEQERLFKEFLEWRRRQQQ